MALGLDSGLTPSIVQFGGQTAINLSEPLARSGMPIMGSSAETIDMAEDRRRFEDFLDGLGIPQPPGGVATTLEGAESVARLIGYPVLVRPSYVLGGRGMEIVHSDAELALYMRGALELGTKHPVLVDKYLEGKEVELDAICDGERVLVPGIMEHLERAGVHSGDAMTVYPGVGLKISEVDTLVDYAVRIGLGLQDQRPDERPVHHHAGGRPVHGLRAGGESPRQPHRSLHLQGHRSPRGQDSHESHGRDISAGTGL